MDADLEVLVYVANVLRNGLVPSAVRANLYAALSKVPGLETTEKTANLDGQQGTALGITRHGRTPETIIDSKSGQCIGERRSRDGTTSSFTSVRTAVVDNIGVPSAG